MALPVPNLDDLQFQRDLVDEARLRIIRYCPEWTEYNVSDPGITLIELFAWMTEMIVYRLNKVPDKNYIKFLDMCRSRLDLSPLCAFPLERGE
jgi:predicted phage baseplate assembly protein